VGASEEMSFEPRLELLSADGWRTEM